MHTASLTSLIVSFSENFQTSDFLSAMRIATATVKVEDGSLETIKSVERVSGVWMEVLKYRVKENANHIILNYSNLNHYI